MAKPIILVADDEPAMMQIMVRRLVRQGYEPDQAEDGRAALECIEKKKYDLIVTDIYMPGVTGLELLRQAKEADSQTQVIVVTAGATLENAVEALNDGAFAYLMKPFDHLSVFDNMVARALQFRQILLDNERLAGIQKRRGDMLEDEVTERVGQLQKRRREMLDMLSSIPDGVLVVEEEGRIVMTNPVADSWLKIDREQRGRPIQTYLDTLHEEWSAMEWEVNLGPYLLELVSNQMPAYEGKQRKIVVIREQQEGSFRPSIASVFNTLKEATAWLSGQGFEDHFQKQIEALALKVTEMEKEARRPQIAFKRGGAEWSEVQIREEDVEGETSAGENAEAEALSPDEGSQEIPSERDS
jgi:DNA-binding response OmpR family regulator